MKKSDLNTINGRFRQVRLDKRLTQDEFAKEIDMTRMGVNAIEIGRYEPRLEILRLIHKRFGVSYSWLIDGDSKDMDIEKMNKEIESLKKVIADQKELIDTQKKLIKAMGG